MNITDLGPQEATIAAAVIGAIVGTSLGTILTVVLGKKARVRAARRRIVGKSTRLIDNYKAELVELHGASIDGDNTKRANKRANAIRLDGIGAALEIEVLEYFRDRRVRATFHKLINRLEETQLRLCNPEKMSEQELQTAFDWIHEMHAIYTQYAANEANIQICDKGGIKFTGLMSRSALQTFIRDTSWTDEPPPWQFSIKYEFHDEPMGPDEVKAVTRAHTELVGAMRCQSHGRPAHIRLHGSRHNFSIEVASCCEDFAKRVKAQLTKSGDIP